MIKTLILQFNIIKIRVVDPFLRIIHSGVSRWQWLRDMATDGPKIPSDKVDVILTVEDGDYPSGCSWIVWDDRCSRETNGGLLVQRQFSSFLERGRLFTRQEVRSLEIGPDKLCFTGDGTGFPNVWKSLDEPKVVRDITPNDAIIDRVFGKAIRSCTAELELADNCRPGDVVEVFQNYSWKMAVVSKDWENKYVSVRLVGSTMEFLSNKFDIRDHAGICSQLKITMSVGRKFVLYSTDIESTIILNEKA
ncbi:hypothetical protein Ahy_B03g063416 isoform G [Arachis hypogaea]|uniref:Uncharacterized protein n=1 Tax=Arachis hypogaea TaxID=3818 RepID=A0A444ZXP7_ARAHY|nr:hypothetical protein Ahy_B03g063416 isoform G [Arachis hypogaea]